MKKKIIKMNKKLLIILKFPLFEAGVLAPIEKNPHWYEKNFIGIFFP